MIKCHTCDGCYWNGNCQYTSPCEYYTPIDLDEFEINNARFMEEKRMKYYAEWFKYISEFD